MVDLGLVDFSMEHSSDEQKNEIGGGSTAAAGEEAAQTDSLVIDEEKNAEGTISYHGIDVFLVWLVIGSKIGEVPVKFKR